jgi:rhomboid protease GluP
MSTRSVSMSARSADPIHREVENEELTLCKNSVLGSGPESYGLAPGHSRKMSAYAEFLKKLFPSFTIKSFTFWVVLLQIIVYGVAWIITIVNDCPEFYCANYLLGAKHTPSIKYKYQIYRLIAPIMLHETASHLLINSIAQFCLGFALERKYGITRYVFIYILSGIGGNLLSAVFHRETISVGSSSSLYGIFALELMFLYQIRPHLTPNDFSCRILTFLVFLFMSVFVSVAFISSIDIYAHFGKGSFKLIFVF